MILNDKAERLFFYAQMRASPLLHRNRILDLARIKNSPEQVIIGVEEVTDLKPGRKRHGRSDR